MTTTNSSIYSTFDLNQSGWLPADWIDQITRLVDEHAIFVRMDGTSSSYSREGENTTGTTYYVVTGDIIYDRIRWLHDLYTGKLVELASQVAGRPVKPSTNLRAGININTLSGTDARYEWHVDSNPLTGMLYVTTHGPEDGGELIFRVGDEQVALYPEAGMFAGFDAREIPHYVAPLKHDHRRISIPMNFYFADEDEYRPAELDAYIYGEMPPASDTQAA
jgi:hypothetical protein